MTRVDSFCCCMSYCIDWWVSAGSGGLIVLLVLMAVESSAPGCCESVAEKTKMTAVGVRSKVTCVVGVVGVCSYISCLRILIGMV